MLSAPGGIGFVSDKYLCSPRSLLSPWGSKTCSYRNLLPSDIFTQHCRPSLCQPIRWQCVVLGLATLVLLPREGLETRLATVTSLRGAFACLPWWQPPQRQELGWGMASLKSILSKVFIHWIGRETAESTSCDQGN